VNKAYKQKFDDRTLLMTPSTLTIVVDGQTFPHYGGNKTMEKR